MRRLSHLGTTTGVAGAGGCRISSGLRTTVKAIDATRLNNNQKSHTYVEDECVISCLTVPKRVYIVDAHMHVTSWR